MNLKQKKSLSHIQIIAIGYFLIVSIGTILLMIPFATKSNNSIPFIDALFTATSATCVTGLVVVDTYQHWSGFGQGVILILIQIGGLGFVTIGVFMAVILRRKIGLKQREMVHESINTIEVAGAVRLTKLIIKGTLIIEAIGAILLAIRFIPLKGLGKGIYYSIFHAVSAFCNAGFDLMGDEQAYSSFVSYYKDPIINIVIMLLIIIGGIGFIVWGDIYKNKFHFKKYMLHSKIVLIATVVLIFGGAFLFFIFENNHLFKEMDLSGKVYSSLFNSVTARTAGFNTTNVGELTDSSKLLTMILMFIGGSPGSTAGGVKTTTIMVIVIYVWANIRRTSGCNICGRRLEDDSIRKASIVFFINLFLALTVAMFITAVQNLPMIDVLFEVMSAIGTVGMTTGITRDLMTVSKVAIIILMYCGRIGSLSFALSFVEGKRMIPVQQPVEKITIG